MSIFSGLEALGLGGLENVKIYEAADTHKSSEEKEEKEEKKVVHEEDVILNKKFECPVCNLKFEQLTARPNKIRVLGHDLDLRPRYDGVDLLKYDVVVCNQCGYANLIKLHGPLPKPYRNLLREKIMPNYKPMRIGKDITTYEEAVMRYKLALMNAVVRQAKNSEKAYIALKLSWIYRGMRKALPEDGQENKDKAEELLALEQEQQRIALEGFKKAQATETPPYAGLNYETLNFLLAVLSMEAGEYAYSKRILSEIITSQKSTKVQKQQAENVLEELRQRMKQNES